MKQVNVRIPLDVDAFLAAEAKRNGSTRQAEFVRACRERMERVQAERRAQAFSSARDDTTTA